MQLPVEIVNVYGSSSTKLTIRELFPSLTTSIFTKTRSFEALQQSFHSHSRRFITLGRMAGLTINFFDLCSFCAFALAGINRNEPEEILWTCLYNDVHMECGHHLVDMECIYSRGIGRFFCQQLYHVPALAGLSCDKEMAG